MTQTIQDRHNGYLGMELLRFTTAGSVDDGKSTLIGRLLYDSKSIFEDQLEALERASTDRGEEQINLAMLTDGLRAEREQGITIDVAYRYFATPERKFIIADTPGHIQYTRNMVTGASTANAALILIDARNGVAEQTIRHSYIASLLHIPHVIVCVNKMDLVGYSGERFREICGDYNALLPRLELGDVRFIPISALKGDNVVEPSVNMPWYEGTPLLSCLEHLQINRDRNMEDPRFPVQYIIRPHDDAYHDYRGYAGRVAGGIFRKGQQVLVLPSMQQSLIRSLDTMNGSPEEAFPPQSLTITLEHDLDISRGDMIVSPSNMPQQGQDLSLMLCWLNEKPMRPGSRYILRHTTREVRCVISTINYRTNINTLEKETGAESLALNEIGGVSIRTTRPLFFDSYRRNRVTGSLILIDESTSETVGAGMING